MSPSAHRLLAHVPADVALWPRLTGAETLELLGRTGPGVDVAYRDELVERFELDLSRPAGTYSTGNRQKVALVAAFATRAPLLVLDEPTSGLDPLMEREFRRMVREARDRGQTVFLSSHQLAEVEAVCDRVGILRAGRLVDVASVAELRRLHRTEVEVRFTGAVPDLTAVPGVDAVERRRRRWRLRFALTGPPAPALRALAAAEVADDGGAGAEPGGDLPRLLRARRPGDRRRRRCGAAGRGDHRAGGPAGRTAVRRWSSLRCRPACRRWWRAPTAAPSATTSTASSLRRAGRQPGDPHPVRRAGRAGRPGRVHGVAHRHRGGRAGRRVGAAGRDPAHPGRGGRRPVGPAAGGSAADRRGGGPAPGRAGRGDGAGRAG